MAKHNKDGRVDDDAFSLFCAYHLGLDRSGRRRQMNLHDVARDRACGVQDVTHDLERYGLTAERLMNLDFDLASARLDIEASPPGVDLPSIARMHWELLQQAEEKPRDWDAEREEDEAANAKIFGDKKR